MHTLARQALRASPRSVAAAVAIGLLVGLSGCGGSAEDATPAPAPTPMAAPTGIGPQGGVVMGPDGVKVSIPPGSLAANADFRVTRNGTGAPPLPEGAVAGSGVYRIAASAETNGLAQITLPADMAALGGRPVRVLYAAPDALNWTPIDTARVAAALQVGSGTERQVSALGRPAGWFVVAGMLPDAAPTVTLSAPGSVSADQVTLAAEVASTAALARLELYDVRTSGLRRVGEIAAPAAGRHQFTIALATGDVGQRNYVAVALRADGQAGASTPLALTVSRPLPLTPMVVSAPRSVQAQPGEAVRLTVEALAQGPLQYQWLRNGTPIAGATGPALELTSTEGAGSLFSAQVSAGGSTVTTAPALVLEQALATTPPTITAQPTATDVFEPNATTITAGISGQDLNYQWQRLTTGRWQNVLGATAASYTLGVTSRNRDHGAQYRLIVSNNIGSVTTNVATLTIYREISRRGGILSAGRDHGIVVRTDYRVYAWGWNANGQLGDNSTTQRLSPTKVVFPNTDTQLFPDNNPAGARYVWRVWSGYRNAMALVLDNNDANYGGVYAWGQNDYGQLGDGTTTQRNSPVDVTGAFTGVGNGAYSMCGGFQFTAVVRVDGTVVTVGRNEFGQLGRGSISLTTDPGLQVGAVPGLTNIKHVSCGGDFVIATRGDGAVFAWGRNDKGQLGDGTTTNRGSPVQITALSNVSVAVAGFEHGVAVHRDGTVWTWGGNTEGQLGNGEVWTSPAYAITYRTTPARVLGISDATGAAHGAGMFHVLVGRGDGVWGWGRNRSGELGLGFRDAITTPTRIPIDNTVASAGGRQFSLFLTEDGTLWGTGNNSLGSFGDGTIQDSYVPRPVFGFNAGSWFGLRF